MKTKKTLELERAIWSYTQKQGTFGCAEVTIGFYGHERVDYITYSTDGIVRCYEIKASIADYKSTAKTSFIGHYNYFVLTPDLFEVVKNDIPKGIGVYVHGHGSVMKARKQDLKVSLDVIKDSMIRSLSREFDKQMRSGISSVINAYNREIAEHKRNANYYDKKCDELLASVLKRYGRYWEKAPEIYNEYGRNIAQGEEAI